jgi:hypothetical protein
LYQYEYTIRNLSMIFLFRGILSVTGSSVKIIPSLARRGRGGFIPSHQNPSNLPLQRGGFQTRTTAG